MGAGYGRVGAPQDRFTPLFVAAHQGKEAVTRVLLQAGTDNEATDPVGPRRGGEGTVK